MNTVAIATYGLLDLISKAGGMWKVITAAAAMIMAPLLYKAFYNELASYFM